MRKGIGDFVEAMRLAGAERFKGRVVGNVKLSDYGRQKVSGVVELIGSIPRSDMAAQYRWADLLVLPSVSDTFGLVILEAMALGLPVIASKNTGGPDILRDGVDGFIVPVMAPEAIADCLMRFARDPKLLQEMSRNSFDRCRLFGMEAYARKLAGLLEPCLRRAVNVTD
jgi:glycosyltransferase involved in cell wall biosynthesis